MSWGDDSGDSSFYRLKRGVIDFVFRNPSYLIVFFLIVGLVVLTIVNISQQITLYRNVMLSIAGVQAIITGYLSFKIYSVGKRDSELPKLRFQISDVKELDTPHEAHMVVRCTVEITNQSYGRAKIKGVDLFHSFNERELERRKEPGKGHIAVGFPQGKDVPTILDYEQSFKVMFQVNGFSYLDEIGLEIEEESLGTVKRQMMVSEISNRLVFKQEADKIDEN